MSFLSTSGNVSFSGMPQTLSEASCATQYKMAVEGVPGCGADGNAYIHDSSGDEHTYMSHISDNFFQTKYKIDPNDLYTFHDSDVIASEITVSHTEDSSLVFVDPNNVKTDQGPKPEVDIIGKVPNGEYKKEVKDNVKLNGHYPSTPKSRGTNKEVRNATKAQKRIHKDAVRITILNDKRIDVQNLKSHSGNGHTAVTSPTTNTKNSINSANVNVKQVPVTKKSASETFLDVFKREQMGLVEAQNIKVEPTTLIKGSTPASRRTATGKSSAARTKRGRGPAVHEALQRIPSQRAQVLVNRAWHAPGEELFECGPLTEASPHPFARLDSSSDDDEQMPNFGSWVGWREEGGMEARGSRLANRRAALRRQVANAAAALRLLPSHRKHRALAQLVKKQTSGSRASRLSSRTLVRLLASRGMPGLLTSHERRRLREAGWSGGESGGYLGDASSAAVSAPAGGTITTSCAEDGCRAVRLPCGRHCLAHVTLAPEQRLYAACAAVFAGGTRCKQPLLPLHDQTPLCTEHAWKRDNYDKISRECKPKKVVRKRVSPGTQRRTKRRRRPPPKRAVHPAQAAPTARTLSEVAASNSSAYDSSEEAALGAISESEFIVTGPAVAAVVDVVDNSHALEVGVVEQVPPDDILDSTVLSQIPDEAFTEFFNQADGTPAFAESEELTRALEAVLDERALESIADCVFLHHQPKTKLQVAPSVGVEMSSSAPS